MVDQAALAVESDSEGLPVGVQITARPWREDVALALMAALESHFRAQSDFPRTPVMPPGTISSKE
jgi:Asp-tRNA(Asn)/Glu-tRNA(Gln) amidotransferase A subunit family amidase